MRERDIRYTALSTPVTCSDMLWEWLVMPQELSNAPATFNRCVTNLLRSVRDFAPSYFDDAFVQRRATDGKTDVEVHRIHVRKVLTLVREHKLFANLKKCIFAANEIPLLGCIVGKNGVRSDPEKIKAISDWACASRRQCTSKVPWLGCVLAQVLAQLRRDDRTSLSSAKEKREVVMEC
uniref:Reverse transcriptase domain-containing protein n=1 Tax=Peronospora matthiolae TaxID=2874970 RepID=A0AAV1U9W3_9STRA